MTTRIALGIHIGPESVSAAYVDQAHVFQLDEAALANFGRGVYWLRPKPGQLDFFSPRDLVGVDVAESDPVETIGRAIAAMLEPLAEQGLQAERVVIALPAAYGDAKRRHLLARLSTSLPPMRLIDSTVAALLASKNQLGDEDQTVAVVVTEDSGLEIALARLKSGRADIFAHQSIEALAGRALNHYLLQQILDRLPADALNRLSEGGEKELERVLKRVSKSRAMLGRIAELAIPVRPSEGEDCVVKLRRADVSAFFQERLGVLVDVLHGLRAQNADCKVQRVLVVGDFGEFPDFTGPMEKLLTQIEVAPASFLADGAALAAQESFAPSEIREAPPLTSLATYWSEHATPLQFVSRAAAQNFNPQDLFAQIKKHVARLIADDHPDAARDIVQKIVDWAQPLLQSLSSGAAVIRHEEPGAAETVPTNNSGPTSAGNKNSRMAKRYMDEADRLLAAGRVLEAVNTSHRANQTAPEDHEILMAMLDVHRRAATLLPGPQNFEAAVKQLRCALLHRQNDATTREALANRLLEHGLYLEKAGKKAEARGLIEEASQLADDESLEKIMEHLDRLEGE